MMRHVASRIAKVFVFLLVLWIGGTLIYLVTSNLLGLLVPGLETYGDVTDNLWTSAVVLLLSYGGGG